MVNSPTISICLCIECHIYRTTTYPTDMTSFSTYLTTYPSYGSTTSTTLVLRIIGHGIYLPTYPRSYMVGALYKGLYIRASIY